MMKRVLAWIMIAGFLLLLVNIFVFQAYLMQSIGLYAVIVLAFVFAGKGKIGKSDNENDTEK